MQHHRNVVKLTLTGTLACVTCTVLALLVINNAPRLLPALLGLERIGSLASALPPDPVPLAFDGHRLDRVELLLPPRLSEPLSLTTADLGSTNASGKRVTPDTSMYHLSLGEADLNTLLRRWIIPDGAIGDRLRDLWIDLQPGGLILYADVNLGLRWQRMGLLLMQEKAGGTTLHPTGLVLGRELHALPDNGPLTRTLLRAQSYSEQALQTLTLVGPLPGAARVSQVQFHADRLEMIARTDTSLSPPPDTGWQPLEPGVELRQIDVATGSVTERITIVRLDPAVVRFSVRYSPANPSQVSGWAARLRPLLVFNGGYFTPENETAVMLISDGESCGTPLEDFAGMFTVTTDGEVSVRWLQERPYDPQEPLTEALQSFPVLVKPGSVMGFPADADEGNPARRTVVAQDRSGDILVVVAPRGYLSLHELAAFLADSDLEVEVALNLDGGGSTGLWLHADGGDVEIDSITPVPSVIVVDRR